MYALCLSLFMSAVTEASRRDWLNGAYSHLPSAANCKRMWELAQAYASRDADEKWREDAWYLAWCLRCPEPVGDAELMFVDGMLVGRIPNTHAWMECKLRRLIGDESYIRGDLPRPWPDSKPDEDK